MNKIKYRIIRCTKGDAVWYEAKYKNRWKWEWLLSNGYWRGDFYIQDRLTTFKFDEMVVICKEHADENRVVIREIQAEVEL